VTNLVHQKIVEYIDMYKRMNAHYDAFESNHGSSLYQLILEHGQEFTFLPFKGRKMKAKRCFHNALHHAITNNLYYCEGYAISGPLHAQGVDIIMEHAWCCDDKSNVIDPTWADKQPGFYFGIKMNRHKVAARCAMKGTYGVIFTVRERLDLKTLNKLKA
jgi:hypothetical protein